MQLSSRWYRPQDPVPLEHIRQISEMDGVVSALHHLPLGETWPTEDLERLAAQVDEAGWYGEGVTFESDTSTMEADFDLKRWIRVRG